VAKPWQDRSDKFKDMIFNKGIEWFDLAEEIGATTGPQPTLKWSIEKIRRVHEDRTGKTPAQTGQARGETVVSERKTVSQAQWQENYGNKPFVIVEDTDAKHGYREVWSPNKPYASRTLAEQKTAWTELQKKIATKTDPATGKRMVFDSKTGAWVLLDAEE